LNTALEAGYRHFDTAYMYSNEGVIGDVIKGWLTSGKIRRDELFITTKLPCIGMEEGLVGHFLKLSLEALKLDYVDLYLVHGPIGLKYVDDTTLYPMADGGMAYDMTTDLLKIWKGMEAQVEAGRTKAIGISNFNVKQIERIVKAAKILPANLQVEAHVQFQQKTLRATCKKHGITLCAYAPLGSPGREKFTTTNEGHKGWGANPGILENPVVGTIAKAHGKSPAQIMLRFLVQQDIVVIPKSTNHTRIFENGAIFDFSLSPAEMKELDALDRGEAGRTYTMDAWAGADKHPEYPHNE